MGHQGLTAEQPAWKGFVRGAKKDMPKSKNKTEKKNNEKRSRWYRGLSAVTAAILLCSQAAVASASSDLAGRIEAAVQLSETNLEENSDAVRLLLQTCMDELDESDPVSKTLQSILFLIDGGSADQTTVVVLLKSLLDTKEGSGTADQADQKMKESGENAEDPAYAVQVSGVEAVGGEKSLTDEPEEGKADVPAQAAAERESKTGLPVFEVTDYIRQILQERVLVDVPEDWGNNDEEGRSLISYSPANKSGAISPASGTLSFSFFSMNGEDEKAAFETYERNISKMSVTSAVSSTDASAAGLNARSVEFTMNVGANAFSCESICFAYEDMIYAIELMQGPLTSYDFFPVYQTVVDSAELGSDDELEEARKVKEDRRIRKQEEQEAETLGASSGQTGDQGQAGTAGQSGTQGDSGTQDTDGTQGDSGTQDNTGSQDQPGTTVVPEIIQAADGDDSISSFQYILNGHRYQFPTTVGGMASGDLPLDMQTTLPYNLFPETAEQKGKFAEIINTEYFYFENDLNKEMAAVTNMSGRAVQMPEGILTMLIDTKGDAVNVALPCGLHVGSPESDILKGFPAFEGMAMDGYARFIGNELLYACNVRDDGCNGYVLIRNDAPYYSTISIICEDQVVREISFECIGSVRAQGVFL